MSDIFPITPNPHAREGALGWVLRSAEENFLQSPWGLYKLVGLCQRSITSPAFDPSCLAGWFGKDPRKLRYMSYRDRDEKSLAFQFREQPVHAGMLDLRAPKICPMCVKELGFIDAFWDLDMVTACPIHQRSLIDRCPSCKKRLTWFRPGRLICRCGASLADVSGEEQPPSVIKLHQQVYEIAFKYSSSENDRSKIDSGPLCDASLRFSMKFIRALGTFHIFGNSHPYSLCPEERIRVIAVAANILSEWPNNFHKFLNAIATRTPRQNQERQGVLGFMDDFMTCLFRTTRDHSEGKEVYLEIRRFLASYWDGALSGRLSKELRTEGAMPLWVSLHAAAEMLRMNARTLRVILKNGKIRHRIDSSSSILSFELYTADLKPEWFHPTPLLDIRQAAQKVGLPVSTLKELRRTGDYVQTYFGPRSHRYAVRDLEVLSARLTEIGTLSDIEIFPSVAFSQAIRINLRSETAKAEIVRNMLSGNIRVIKERMDAWPNVRINSEDLDKIVRTMLLPSEASWTLPQAARAINMDQSVFKDLVSQGAVEIVCSAPQIYVAPASVLDFRNNFFRLNLRLHYSDRNIREALKACVELRLRHYSVMELHYFMRKEDFHLIVSRVFKRRPRSI